MVLYCPSDSFLSFFKVDSHYCAYSDRMVGAGLVEETIGNILYNYFEHYGNQMKPLTFYPVKLNFVLTGQKRTKYATFPHGCQAILFRLSDSVIWLSYNCWDRETVRTFDSLM